MCYCLCWLCLLVCFGLFVVLGLVVWLRCILLFEAFCFGCCLIRFCLVVVLRFVLSLVFVCDVFLLFCMFCWLLVCEFWDLRVRVELFRVVLYEFVGLVLNVFIKLFCRLVGLLLVICWFWFSGFVIRLFWMVVIILVLYVWLVLDLRFYWLFMYCLCL